MPSNDISCVQMIANTKHHFSSSKCVPTTSTLFEDWIHSSSIEAGVSIDAVD
jgi:hypothetical protein